MPDLETSIRRLLDDRAGAVPASGDPPSTLLRRARMRRLRNGACAASALVVALLLGGSIAFGLPGAERTATDLATQPPPSVEVTEPSTTAVPTTVPNVPLTTVAPARGPTTTRVKAPAPVYVDGVPQVKATPASGKVGTRVRVEGYGFSDQQWAAPDASLWLVLDGPGCSLYAEARHGLRVSSGGRLAGEFTVPARGDCRQSDRGNEPVIAGRYRIAYSCTVCFIGEFRVTSSPAATIPCQTVGFTPDSDDAASSIVARNMPCSEAEALVRKVAQPLGFNGPATAEADGFRCVRTGQDDEGLARAFYECTNGAKQVTFTRS